MNLSLFLDPERCVPEIPLTCLSNTPLEPIRRVSFATEAGTPLLPLSPPPTPQNVSYTRRAITINGKPELLFTATIHYPRSDPSIWPALMARIKAAGNNAIDTYVFWNVHEPEEGVYDFENGIANLPLFLKHAQDAGLYVVLRIGPYVCAEWNFGGFPVWLLNKPGMELRTYNELFMKQMSRFIKKTLKVVHEYLAPQGGPIILLQIENEYGSFEKAHGERGSQYIQWAGEFTQSLDAGVPWFMCYQDNVPTVLNAQNGFYADNWIEGHHRRFPDQPAMVTELWSGWFQKFGQPKYARFAEDVAYASARFIAKGGTYVAYYMWHGGTNFGRWGSDFKTTSYNYEAPLTEFGFPNNPKHNHLAEFHHVLNNHKGLLLSNEPVDISLGVANTEAQVYGDLQTRALVFLSNMDATNDVTITFEGKQITLPHWSVSLYLNDKDGLRLLFCTVTIKPSILTQDVALSLASIRSRPESTDLLVSPSSISHIVEPIGIFNSSAAITSQKPLEQIRTTVDRSDYLWYVRRGISIKNKRARIYLGRVEDVAHVFLDGKKIHSYVILDLEAGLSAGKIPAKPVELPVEGIETAETHELAILASVAGIWNFGAFLERVEKGILGPVVVDGVDLSNGEWVHQIGLQGEEKKYHLGSKVQTKWNPSLPSSNTPLVWHLIRFSKKTLLRMLEEATDSFVATSEQSFKSPTVIQLPPITAFVLFLGTMTRGLAYVNGNAVGRYWDLKAECRTQVPCKFPDSASNGGETCASGCGYPSQTWYNVPVAWIEDVQGNDVEVVLFDEVGGGDPSSVSFGVVVG
ncbi:hypothetical protein HDU79_011012 [Rhizoclosmatium sp. JEL0117]|nr:hypothetical protein HDU79_011012 [Rhizoclosmatium sp. JEL0117]